MNMKKKISSKKKKQQKAFVTEVEVAAVGKTWNTLIPFVSALVVIVASCVIQFGIYYANNGGGSSSGMPSAENSPAVLSLLTSYVCKANGGVAGFCHDNLEPTRRTHRPKRRIKAGERILTVPRKFQIWDLDALRDPYIGAISKSARHHDTGNPIDSGAFLAVYLVRRHRMAKMNMEMGLQDDLLPYFTVLPTFDELKSNHPLMWESEEMILELLPNHSSAYEKIHGYRMMIGSEYKSIRKSFVDSTEFMKEVTEEEYWTMRVNVLSRSFATGPPGQEEAREGMSMEEEIQLYKSERGIDLSLGCKAMVPVLDMYDHHAKPNAIWKYEPQSGAFVVDAGPDGINAKHEVMISYGNLTDSHLMARYGFSNGDGSDKTEASLAMHHTFYDLGLGQEFSLVPANGLTEEMVKKQLKQIVAYMEFDDGYSGCLNETNTNMKAMELKYLKLQLLSKIANNRTRWIVELPSRKPSAKPGKSTGSPSSLLVPFFENNKMNFNGDLLLATCRLITLTEGDYGGNAIEVLREVVQNNTGDTFLVGQNHPSNEFLSYKCLERLASLQQKRFAPKPQATERRLLKKKRLFYTDYHNWTAAHVRLGEIQTLDGFIESVKKFSSHIYNQIPKHQRDHPRWSPREDPCPPEYSLFLVPT